MLGVGEEKKKENHKFSPDLKQEASWWKGSGFILDFMLQERQENLQEQTRPLGLWLCKYNDHWSSSSVRNGKSRLFDWNFEGISENCL